MTTRKSNSSSAFRELLRPLNIVLCQDVLQGRDGSVSYYKLVDSMSVPALPAQLGRLVIALEIQRANKATNDELGAADPKIQVTLTGPDGKEGRLTEMPSIPAASNKTWRMNRIIIDTPGIRFTQEGLYLFRIFGKTASSDYELILEKDLLIDVAKTGTNGNNSKSGPIVQASSHEADTKTLESSAKPEAAAKSNTAKAKTKGKAAGKSKGR
ncbi:MAG: hypothetical protein K2X93_29205 [Candidatus Obscuribacterales bacterium]|nr:hypothetical protein [Candidatus Obscuribacterales bacterium]